MIDPLTTFAVAGNVLQFVQLGIDIVRKTIEYASDGGNIEHQRLHDLIQHLTTSNAHLQKSLQEDAAQQLPPGPARALRFANEECLAVAKEFSNVLVKLKLNRSQTLWNSVKLSLKSFKLESKIKQLSKNLEHTRGNLVLSLLVYLHSATSSNMNMLHTDSQKVMEEARKISQQNSSIQASIAGLHSKLFDLAIDDDGINNGLKPTTNINSASEELLETKQQPNICANQTGKLVWTEHGNLFKVEKMPANWNKMQGHNNQYHAQLDRVLLDNHSTLQPIVHKLFDALLKTDEFTKVSTDFQTILPSIDRDLLGRRRVSNSLYYQSMNYRRNHITRAHGQTFQWLFKKSSKQQDVVWHEFCEWLSVHNQDPIYWIFGKPGCGKSTLMREIDEKINGIGDIEQWVQCKELLKCSCYFWWAGTAEQKSLQGFLQSLLYQLFQHRPDLINKVLQPKRWEDALLPQLQLHQWEEHELVDAIQKILLITQEDSKVLLLVDGLDEFDGTDELRQHFLNLLVTISVHPHVKACVASRPWNHFRDKFKSCPQLRLEDLTHDDIDMYVRENLAADSHFLKQQERWDQQQNESLLDMVLTEIVDKARGVFLWVRLVVRDLLKVLRDGGRPQHLFKELKHMPSDLNEYFMRMINMIDSSYRKEAAMILQVALCDMGCYDTYRTITLDVPFPLLYLEYLEEDVDPYFALQNQMLCPGRYADLESNKELLEDLERRLASRCMGLLETSNEPDFFRYYEYNIWSIGVEFLHRTVKDFLITGPAQELLQKFSGNNFDAHLFCCNGLVVNADATRNYFKGRFRLDKFSCLFQQLKNRSEVDNLARQLFRTAASALDKEFNGFCGSPFSLNSSSDPRLQKYANEWRPHQNSVEILAHLFGLEEYLAPVLSEAIDQPSSDSSRNYHSLDTPVKNSTASIARASATDSHIPGKQADPCYHPTKLVQSAWPTKSQTAMYQTHKVVQAFHSTRK